MMMTAATLFDRMSALADPVRGRVLLAVERHELRVSELCSVFQLPQSTMSRHLKVLADEGWVAARAEGTSRRYTMAPLDLQTRKLWQLVREQVAALPAADQDAQRVSSVLAQRKSRSQEFFSSAAGEWDRVRAELFGRRSDLVALLGLMDEEWTVGDLGCGTGQIAEALAPFTRRVIAVDDSAAMLGAARRRLGGRDNVEVRAGQVESLPIGDAELDAAILFLVMHFVADPLLPLLEAHRVLKPGGRLLVVDMTPHDREEYRARMGHVWLGFSPDQLGGWMERAGLSGWRYVPLPADSLARGPALFAATARKWA
jgi:ubiquinone/menaquinone biosynthesis C-methylase UbiE